jgi:DNA-binding NtrC family response regulator
MKKVLLVFDDYNELTATEVYLKKVGFDVVGISNESKLADQLLIFNPDIVVANGRTQMVSSLSVGQKLRDNHKFTGKAVIIVPQGFTATPQDMARSRIDAAIEAPVQPVRLIQVLAKFSNQDAALLIDKYKKATRSESVPVDRPPSTDMPQTDDHARVSKYKKYLDSVQFDSKSTTFGKQDIKDRQKELKKDWDFDELERIDKLKRQFANALFKK